ncbi:MAG: iron uptake transporter permease EfeU [Propionibacteriaceae bacterium]|nr:iron uptake transporter permease EfeU [Propionibacteriaceae bacterium]
MFLASFLIGLREGLEAALIIGILIAFVRRQSRPDVVRKIWFGVGIAVTGSLALGALFTFGRYGLSFEGQELIGGSMSILAVAMVTWMVFWMMNLGRRMKEELETSAAQALALGAGWGMFWLAFVSVGREGIETTLMLWGWALQPVALLGAVMGIAVSIALGYLVYRGMVRIRFSVFFAWTGGFLIIVAAGILAYGIHDLQEARFLPGPFSGAPITPLDFRTGEVLVGFFTDRPFWGAAYPFGWAFDLQDIIEPSGALAAFLKGTIGFAPLMSWLEVTAWGFYLAIVFPIFLRRVRLSGCPGGDSAAAKPLASPAEPISLQKEFS